jgi:hypothetical protein
MPGRHFGLTMADIKAVEFAGGGSGMGFDPTQIAGHLLLDRFHYVVHLLLVPFHDQLDAAIGQIADIALDVVPQGDVLSRVTEAHPLNVPAEVVGTTLHIPNLADLNTGAEFNKTARFRPTEI